MGIIGMGQEGNGNASAITTSDLKITIPSIPQRSITV